MVAAAEGALDGLSQAAGCAPAASIAQTSLMGRSLPDKTAVLPMSRHAGAGEAIECSVSLSGTTGLSERRCRVPARRCDDERLDCEPGCTGRLRSAGRRALRDGLDPFLVVPELLARAVVDPRRHLLV